jgi:hypothetical protein
MPVCFPSTDEIHSASFIDKRLSLSVHWLDEAEHFYDDEVESFPCSSFQLFPGEDESWIPAVLATLADTTTTSKKLTVPIQVSFDGIIRPNITKIVRLAPFCLNLSYLTISKPVLVELGSQCKFGTLIYLISSRRLPHEHCRHRCRYFSG